MNPHLLIPAAAALLVAFLIWRRIRSQFGRQPVRRQRMMVRIAIFTLLLCVFGLRGLHDIRLVEGLAGGLLLGSALGLLGLKLTRFEQDSQLGDVYIPSAWMGGLITALLIGRLAWRLLVSLPQVQAAVPAHGPPIGDSPLTLLVFGLTFGYYIVYFIGLLIHHRRFINNLTPAKSAR